MSHSVSSTEEVISQCLLREKRLGLQEREGEGENTELSILRRESWRELEGIPDDKGMGLDPTCVGVPL